MIVIWVNHINHQICICNCSRFALLVLIMLRNFIYCRGLDKDCIIKISGFWISFWPCVLENGIWNYISLTGYLVGPPILWCNDLFPSNFSWKFCWSYFYNVLYFCCQGHLLVLENFHSLKLNHGIMEAGYVDHQAATLKSNISDSKALHDAQNSSISMTATVDTSGNLLVGMSAIRLMFSFWKQDLHVFNFYYVLHLLKDLKCCVQLPFCRLSSPLMNLLFLSFFRSASFRLILCIQSADAGALYFWPFLETYFMVLSIGICRNQFSYPHLDLVVSWFISYFAALDKLGSKNCQQDSGVH